jgi:hypothetical protein
MLGNIVSSSIQRADVLVSRLNWHVIPINDVSIALERFSMRCAIHSERPGTSPEIWGSIPILKAFFMIH